MRDILSSIYIYSDVYILISIHTPQYIIYTHVERERRRRRRRKVLFKADAVNEEDSERDRATQV